MQAVLPERQWLFPKHGTEWKIGIKMREEIATAGGFPFQRLAEEGGIHGHEQEVGLSGKMQPCGLDRLSGRREMDVSVLEVYRRALENTRNARLLP